ncbi:phospholipid carrier-dependent glycosyltransferase [Nostoc sp. TCL26-01]|uniref:glycosyltransferase family 39 protein n=1 Tax=Nostoc sp. TCL26-01 TaxID=2576904 RepID=UPI0015BA55D5|nr:glycosyltransferase family 39 protein [Nostoc sp. TCL26-01]QLE55226.1 phospholipid carrier-dependent glycosyltransferase [Nostoc sp. TCL26-01]
MKNHPHLLLLMLWLAIGVGLRFLGLATLPPWTDECATMVFSLGHSFRTVPLNQLISPDVLLQPLQILPTTGVSQVVENLLNESNHPPVYFVLVHFWLKMFSPTGEIASIWVVRSLSALLGIISIPAMFGLGYVTFGSKLVGQMAAAMMAVSPYIVFLSREARHYSLAMLLVIASLFCLVKAIQGIHRQQSLPIWLILVWIIINSLGVATHYFFSFTLLAQGIVLLGQIWQTRQEVSVNWRRIAIVAVGTLMGCLVWVPVLQNIPGSDLTTWVASSNPQVRWLEPLGRLLLWLLSMLLLLPSALTSLPLTVAIASGVVTLLFLGWSVPHLINGLKVQQQNPHTRLGIQIISGYIVVAIALCLFFTYVLGQDLTLAARFQFIIAPAVILLLGSALAGCWVQAQEFKFLVNAKVATSIILLMATLGGITVVGNLGYLQNQRPDILAAIIDKASPNDVLIATTHLHHGQTGRLMGLAWELPNQPGKNLQFFLARQDAASKTYTQSTQVLSQQLTKLPRPLDLWLVEFRTPVDLASQNCIWDKKPGRFAGEYSYRVYRCAAKTNNI